MKKTYWPYIVPFVAFLILTYGAAWLPGGTYIGYPIKTLVMAAVLWYYRKVYTEIRPHFSWLAVGVGILTFVLWVLPEGWYPQIGSSEFNPYAYGEGWEAYVLIGFRLAGAVIVVPIFEELFWRSFALRWLINEDFTSVAIGTFTWFSCCVVILGFGFEHHRWLVGLVAGVLYHALLYYKKDLFECILAHAVTNLLLGIYVLVTQQWTFW
jgi:CAAX prenyl protease-like protein